MEGLVVGGRYRLVSVLGSGGFGAVWRARDEILDVDVAVKQVVVPRDASPAERAEMADRAHREARSAARLRDHPHVVTVHDVVLDSGLPWMVMRLVQGRSLRQELNERERLPVAEVERIAAGVLSALVAAHAVGVIHRDVKPENVMLTPEGEVLLADFGIAKQDTATTLTAPGTLIGSLPYMSPERLEGRSLPVSDVFALGATMYEMLEGFSPFQRNTATAVLSAVVLSEPPFPARAGGLGDVVMAMLGKDPASRPDARAASAMLAGHRSAPTAGAQRKTAQASAAERQGRPATRKLRVKDETGFRMEIDIAVDGVTRASVASGSSEELQIGSEACTVTAHTLDGIWSCAPFPVVADESGADVSLLVLVNSDGNGGSTRLLLHPEGTPLPPGTRTASSRPWVRRLSRYLGVEQ